MITAATINGRTAAIATNRPEMPEGADCREIVPIPRGGADGQPRYVYADTAGCKCLYAGGQAAYDKYQRMVAREDAELK